MIRKVGIIGSGAMGSGIAQVASMAGCDVVLYDIKKEQLSRAQQSQEKIINRLAEKGKISNEDAVAILSRIHYTTEMSAFTECELMVEAIVENIAIKKEVFTQIEAIVSENTILASNTSSLSINEMAALLSKRSRFIGLHFFNPPGLMKLVEVIPSVFTAPEIISTCKKTMENWGKIAVLAQDSPGFIVNKVARPFYSEALRIVEEGTANSETVDYAMTEIGGFRMGPFTLMDYIGHDVNYTVTESVWKAFYYDERYTPSFLQKRLVQAGFLGRKTGRGFYTYEEGKRVQQNITEDSAPYIFRRIIAMLINEAADTVFRGICSEEDVELAMKYGVNYPKGLLEWAEELGVNEVVQTLDMLYDRYHESRYRVSPYLRDRISIL